MNVVMQNWHLFLYGLFTTVRLAVVTLLISTLIGVVLGSVASSRMIVLRRIVRGYVELLRAIPLLVNLFCVYFVTPLLGLSLTPYVAVVVGLSLWGGANGAEIVRGGIEGVPSHQRESAAALGLRRWQVSVLIVFPQALRSILPAFTGLLTLLLQSTSLGALVGVPEFFRVGQTVIERSTVMQGLDPAFAIYGFMLAVYFVLCSILTWAARTLDQRLSREYGSTFRLEAS